MNLTRLLDHKGREGMDYGCSLVIGVVAFYYYY